MMKKIFDLKKVSSFRAKNRMQVLLGERIQEIRIQKNMTLSELSLTSGVQIATLSRIEHNIMAGSLETHAQIAKAFGIELWELYKDVRIVPKED